MSEPRHLEIARAALGLKEKAGGAHEARILEMFNDVGHGWVDNDETAWCAAFVGSCLERSGIRSTRALNARSYLSWGEPVSIEEARPGDVAVFSRGKEAWQGHVGFVLAVTAKAIRLISGNSGNAVTDQLYPRFSLLGIRRASGTGAAASASPAPVSESPRGILKLHSRGAHVQALQTALKAKGFHPGATDGKFGPNTRAAVLKLQAQRGIATDGMAGPETWEALDDPRFEAEVWPERAKANTQTLLEDGSVIADATVKGQGGGAVLVLGGGVTLLSQVMGFMAPVKALFAEYGVWLAVSVLVGVGGYVVWQNRRALKSRIQMRRTGEMG
ncbi:MAG: TIGR02594 family protein [Parvibaculaceae bacterium]